MNVKRFGFPGKWSKALVWLVLVAALAGGFVVLRGREHKEAEVPVENPVFLVKTYVLHRPGETFSREYPGAVQSSNQVDLSFRVAGPLVELPVKEGMNVAAGDLIAAVDSRDFQTDLNEAVSALDNAGKQLEAMKRGARKEDIAVAQANLSSAQAKLTEAKANYERFKNLLKEEAISESEFDKYRTSYDVAKAGVAAAQQDLQKAKTGARPEDIQAMEAQIRGLEAKRKAAEDSLKDTRLLAPFDGTVTSKFVDNFQDVNAKQPIVRLQNLGDLEILIYVPERDMARASSSTGKSTFTARFDSIPNQVFPLRLKEWGTQPDNQTQTYPVKLTIALAGSRGNVLPGMAATVEVQAALQKDMGGGSYVVPVEAVVEDAEDSSQGVVWVVDEEKMVVASRPVTLGAYSTGSVTVAGMLSSGERIVAAGARELHDGDKVQLFLSRERGSDD